MMMPPIPKTLSDKLKGLTTPRKLKPLWKGPHEDGITYSMLSRFLVCRERFRVSYIEGLRPVEVFTPSIEFGQMWHVCEEALAGETSWQEALKRYAQELCRKFVTQQEAIQHWYTFTLHMFPIYVDHWSQHPDVTSRTPLFQEQVFDVPYRLPSGRVVRLRGKWDSVDLIKDGQTSGVYIQENKTKSSIDGGRIARQLSFDLQTMIYLVAYSEIDRNPPPTWKGFGPEGKWPLRGVRYNVIRRSSHKSVESLLKKIGEDSSNGRIDEWFARWSVLIGPKDIERFCLECLNPILEQLCDWWDWIKNRKGAIVSSSLHWRHPFGVHNVLNEGGFSDLDEYLATGSTVGLERREQLFEELQ